MEKIKNLKRSNHFHDFKKAENALDDMLQRVSRAENRVNTRFNVKRTKTLDELLSKFIKSNTDNPIIQKLKRRLRKEPSPVKDRLLKLLKDKAVKCKAK